MVATAQRFAELHPGVEIEWEARSLQDFADFSVARLAQQYDLIVIDHPSCGQAAEEHSIVSLNDWIPAEFLAAQGASSVGGSHASYEYSGQQWALAIDAAAPVSGWRSDLLKRAGTSVPRTWTELLDLAKRGLVTFPAKAIDSLMHFYMFCDCLGEAPFRKDDVVVSEEIGMRARRRPIVLSPTVTPTIHGPATRSIRSKTEISSQQTMAAPFARRLEARVSQYPRTAGKNRSPRTTPSS